MPSLWLAVSLSLLGHNPDTSYARIQIAPDRIQTRLTYDVFTLLKVVELDDNRDGQLTRGELAGHAPEIARFLREHIGLAVSAEDETADLGEMAGFVWPPDVGEAIPAADYHSANGLIHFDFVRPVEKTPEEVAIAFGFFEQFGERHTVLAVFAYRGEEYETTFSRFEPEFTYVTGVETAAAPNELAAPDVGRRPAVGQVGGVGRPAPSAGGGVGRPAPSAGVGQLGGVGRPAPSTGGGVGRPVPNAPPLAEPPARPGRSGHFGQTTLVDRLWRFFKLGVEHIFLGYDHICFLIALIVVSKFREVVKIITSFTVAHSITLILATLDVVQLPGRLVETCIAATIVYVAVENLWVEDTRHRWWLTFAFGLVHGFGFAGVLRELGLPTTGLMRCLLAFNLGVEVGQLIIATALLPLALVLARWKHGKKVVVTISVLLALFGLAWFVDRALALDFMPF